MASNTFDLHHKLTNDLRFNHKLTGLLRKLVAANIQIKTKPAAKKIVGDTVKQILELCQYNLSPLVPFYFPTFDSGRPFTFKDHPFAMALYDVRPLSITTLRGSRQIGKSTNLTVRDILLTRIFPGYHTFTLCPKHEQIKTFANKFKEMESYYRHFRQYKNLRNGLFFKELPNKSTSKFTYAFTNAASVRGNAVDSLNIDEYQDFDNALEVEIEQILSASKHALRMYSGTSLTTDSALECKWEESSRSVWVMPCPACNHDNMATEEGDVMKMIGPVGPVCVKCERRIDTREGFWEDESPATAEAGHKGLHIPKIIVPAVVEDPAKWNEVYVMSRTVDQNLFKREALGIPSKEGAREITIKQLEDMCILGSQQLLIKNKNKYRYIVSGCDWGGSDYIPAMKTKLSYTVHAILGITNARQFDILSMKQYSGMDYENIAGEIIHDHNALGACAIGTDFGVGAQYNNLLRKRLPPNRHFIFTYTGPTTAMFSVPSHEYLFNQYTINKTETITSLYEAFKSLRIRCYDWQIAKARLSECLNLIRAPNESQTGMTNFRYIRHGSRSDDTLHAINYAYLFGRILLGEPLFVDQDLYTKVNETLFGEGWNLNGEEDDSYEGISGREFYPYPAAA